MYQVNGNPVIGVLMYVTSHRKVGPHNPFNGTTEKEVLDTVFSLNGVWALSAEPIMFYRYEMTRLMEVEMYKNDYLTITQPDAILGWSEYSIKIGTIIRQTDHPTREVAEAESKS